MKLSILKAIIMFMFVYSINACGIDHFDLWQCALKDACMNKFQLHSAIRSSSLPTLKRPYLLAVEGPQYKKLFQDCDANNDGCISIIDIQNAGHKCERSCMWRNTMKDLLC
jgi:hypothetical protein